MVSFLLLDLLVQFGDRPRLLDERMVLFADLPALLFDERPAGGNVGGEELRVVHVSKYTDYCGISKRCEGESSIPRKRRRAFREAYFAKSPL